MRIALIRDPESTNGHTWEQILTTAGHIVCIVESRDDYAVNKSVDLCLPLITVHDFTHHSTCRYGISLAYEANGIPMVNSSSAIAVSSDKLQTYSAWRKADIVQPITHALSAVKDTPNVSVFPMILKPALGHSGENVYLVHSITEALAKSQNIEGVCLLQEYIPDARSIRIIASGDIVFSCYERILPGAIAANVSQGATRHYFTPSDELTKLAKQMVATLDGGLMGVDILEKDGKYYALEANVPFGFDPTDQALHARLAGYINDLGN